ncbi:MAG: hypothetical protein KAR33_02120 [Candidatus Thorarchaeota archaeon]|nr:hypothetical protein [Candidatus Thorarchaeota archaeon]
MNRVFSATISQRNYRAVLFLFAWSCVVLAGVLIFVYWMNPIVDFAILILIAGLVYMFTLILLFRRKYPPSARYD